MAITEQTIQRKVSEIQSEITRVERELAGKRARLEVLEELLIESEQPTLSDVYPRPRAEYVRNDVKKTKSGTSSSRAKQGATGAILSLLKERQPLTCPQIIDALVDVVESSAKNKRHNLRTTVFNLHRGGKITKNEDDTYSLAQ